MFAVQQGLARLGKQGARQGRRTKSHESAQKKKTARPDGQQRYFSLNTSPARGVEEAVSTHGAV
jgi:hypothetical protein